MYNMQQSWNGELQTPEARQMGMFVHLGGILNAFAFPFGFIVPLILWQTQKNKFPALDAHGKMTINWAISLTIYIVASIILVFVLVGILGLLVFGVLALVFPIIGAIKANNGELWKYPLTIKFLK